MLLGCIADDFTGAGDVANTLSREGMRTRLFIGSDAVTSDACDAGVVALKTRSIAPHEAVAQSLAALERLLAAGCRQIVFKYCSTFDSTPAGNIGPVAEALAKALGVTGVIVCPAFPANGRTVYLGHLFVADKLLSQSGMERHPLTPMTDPDIRRWLALQTASPVGHVDIHAVRQGAARIADDLAGQGEAGCKLVVVDAIDDDDLRAIGHAARGHRLVTGGSGVALGLPANFRDAGLLTATDALFEPQAGPALILSGSCSTATRAQVEQYRSAAPSHEIDAGHLLEGAPVLAEAEAFMHTHAGDTPLIYSSADPVKIAGIQQKYGQSRAAEAVEALFGALARRAVDAGVRRLVVAGGETSGAVVGALGVNTLDLGPEIDPGVPALSAHIGATSIALALKSGNFGSSGFMSRALLALEGGNGRN